MARETGTEQEPLPPGTTYGWDLSATTLTFAFPIDGTLPGWVAVLRFGSRGGLVELRGFEVAYFADPLANLDRPDFFPEPTADEHAVRLEGAFRDWIQPKIAAPSPSEVPSGGLTIRHLRGIRVGDFQTAARRYLARTDTAGWMPPGWAGEAIRRPGGAGRGDLHYAQLAAAYVDLLGTERAPVKTLAKRLHLDASTVRNQLAEARERELLTRPGARRTGGELTSKAMELLKENADGQHR